MFLSISSLDIGINRFKRSGKGGGSSTTFGLAASRFQVPTTMASTASPFTSRREHYASAFGDISNLVFVDVGWQMQYTLSSTYKIKKYIEYPEGVFTQVLWDGAGEVTITAGDTVYSDPTVITIPAGAKFWERTVHTTGTATTIPLIELPDDSVALGVDDGNASSDRGNTNIIVASGNITTIGSAACYGTIAAANAPSLVLIGDSITFGQGDGGLGDYHGSGYPARLCDTLGIPYMKMAKAGDKADDMVAGSAGQQALLTALPYSHVLVQYGVNDLRLGETLANTQADLETIYSYAKVGIPIIQATITPRADSTDAYATTANQTAKTDGTMASLDDLNASIRTLLTGQDKILEMADAFMSARDSDIWKAPGYTTDGTHPTDTAIKAALADVADDFDTLINYVPAMTNYYVNPAIGSDSNDGLTAATPFATLAGLGDPVASTKINIARGSTFKEQWPAATYTSVTDQLDFPQNIVIAAYGIGKKPVLDASDVITGTWTQPDATGTPNIWTIDVTMEVSGGYMSVWADGTRLRWYSTSSALNTSAAAGFASSERSASTTETIYIYSATDPNSNGVVYEVASRNYGLVTGQNWNVYDMHTTRNQHDNGSFVLAGGSKGHRCIFSDGVKHNAFCSANTVLNDCITWKSDWPERIDHIGIVGFELDGSSGTIVWNRCIGLGGVDQFEYALNNGKGMNAFYTHTDEATGHDWSAVTMNDCAAQYFTAGAELHNVTATAINRLYTEDCAAHYNLYGTTNNALDCYDNQGAGAYKQLRSISCEGDVTIDGQRLYVTDGFPADAFIYHVSSAGHLSLKNSVIVRGGTETGYTWLVRQTETGSTFTMEDTILQSWTSDVQIKFANPVSVDNNVYRNGTSDSNAFDFNVDGVDYADFAAYRTAHPELDADTITTDPLIADAANGDFTATGTTAGIVNSVTYTVIPTTTELGNM